MEIQNKKIPEGEFMKLRQEVLTQWPTGQGVDLEDAFAFHKSLPQEKVFSQSSSLPSSSVKTLVQPRAGVPVIEEHVKLLQFLQNEGGRRTCFPAPLTVTPVRIATKRQRTASGSPCAWAGPCSTAFPQSTMAYPAAVTW